jgi:hypothetical protein
VIACYRIPRLLLLSYIENGGARLELTLKISLKGIELYGKGRGRSRETCLFKRILDNMKSGKAYDHGSR